MIDTKPPQELDLAIRHFVYQHIAVETRPPTTIETVHKFNLTLAQVEAAYSRLHHHHFLFLEPGTTDIRMANPFSAVATNFRVRVGQKAYWANCAWDMLGIPAALNRNATIEAVFEDSGERALIRVAGGQLLQHPGGMVHFPLPVRRWYDDLILT